MIEKIIHIKNIGRFRDYNAAGDVGFQKLTLIYAGNGHGKTTLCAILRSLQTGQSAFISERKTLAASDPTSVNIRLNGTSVQYANDVWTATHPDIAIFDSVFINDNVYSGDYIEHEHKKNLYRIIVGAYGVTLARQVDDLDGQIRAANNDIRTKKDAVEKYQPQDMSLEQFMSMSPVDDIELKIKQKSEEIARRQKAVEKASEIQSKGFLEKIQIPSIPDDFTSILERKLIDISHDAEICVRAHISRCMDHLGEPWLAQGLRYIKDDKCPFCSHDISANDLITAYHSYFNAEYIDLKQSVIRLEQRVSSSIGESSLNSVQQILSSNLTLIEFWRQFQKSTVPEFPIPAIVDAFERLYQESKTLIKIKLSNPLETITPSEDFTKVINEIEKYRRYAGQYNSAVEVCNAKIKELKETTSQDYDLSGLRKQLTDLEVAKRRFDYKVVQACQEYHNAIETKKALDDNKQDAKNKLGEYCVDIIKAYEKSINIYLDQFNTGFRIVNTKHQYTGGTPSSQFQIAINNTPVNLGDSRTNAGTPCFKTTLSSGDRSALALAFFLAALKKDKQLVNKIVVLDDPFTSLDRFRRTCTQQLIRQLYSNARQVIILSHDPYFLKLLWDRCPPNDVKTLQISKTHDTTVIGEWDIHAETQEAYLRDFSILLEFYRERRGEPVAVVRAIRPFLERMLRCHFPGHFLPNEWLGQFIEKIRNAVSPSGLLHAQADLSELEAINDYSKKYHHDQNANADMEQINDDELHSYVKRCLRLVGGE